jgi:hypothetical protein
MKIFSFHTPHVSHKEPSEHQQNIKYGTLLVVGTPVVVFGARYIVEGIFRWLW